jgi:hypothetical protein
MLDLAILLSFALAVTALLGLLWVGFIWVPWFIGLVLLVLLVALMKMTHPDEPQALVSPHHPLDSMTRQGQEGFNRDGSVPPASPPIVNPPTMVYRGVKYRRSSNAEGSPSITQGKYRGQPWSR